MESKFLPVASDIRSKQNFDKLEGGGGLNSEKTGTCDGILNYI